MMLRTAGAMGPQGGMPGMNQMGAQGTGQVKLFVSTSCALLAIIGHSTAWQVL